MSRYSYSQMIKSTLTAVHTLSSTGKTKNPAYVSISRVEKVYFESLPAYASSIQNTFGGFPARCRG